ncbi:pfs domain-containing protein, partial [Colletotrichum sublineola]
MSNPLDYTIGWICAISTEYVAARAFLDSVHDPPSHVAPHDSNEYTLGRMGKHNVVIAVLPDGEYGLSTASAVAKGMLNSFPHVRAGLMVGIAGGAPTRNPGRDIRLGDVVVSSPRDGHGGVFQYDFGKLIQGQSFKPSRILNQPPDVLRAAVAGLKAEFEERGHTIIEDIEEALKKRPKLRLKYSRPSPETDRLFLSHVTLNPNNPIENPGPELLVSRKLRTTDEDDPAVFYGLIASANQLMKDANMRDQLATDRGVLCFEMEAAGLMNHFPCLVIRGICDYSDSHKNKDWQGYAAMTAAAYAKALVCRVQRTRLENEPKLTTLISQMKMVKRDVAKVKYQMENQVDNRILDRLSIADEAEYDSHFNQHEPKCHPETRISLLKRIEIWAKDRRDQRIYWLSGSAGTGKSTISRTVAKHFDDEKLLAATFFFKRGVASCSKASLLFSTVSRQLARRRPEAQQFILKAITKADNISSKGIAVQFNNLVLNPLERTYAEISFKETLILVLDALDECSVDEDIETFVPLLAELASSRTCNLKVFVTSRPEVAIRYTLGPVKELLRVKLHEIEPHVVSQDIMVFLRDSLSEIRERWNKRKSTDPSQQLEAAWPGTRKLQALADMADRLFIFAATTCRFIADPLYSPEKQLSRVLKTAMESGINDRLTPTYLPVLWQFKTGRSKRETDILLGRFRRVVGTLVLLQEPLPIASIAGLVATDEIDVDHILDSLSSVIDIPEDRRSAVKPFHLSFRDFLLGPEAGDFALDLRKTHQNIAVDCLDLLTKRQPLHYNMC